MTVEPRWDITAAIGHQGEMWVNDIKRGIAEGSIEVKHDTVAPRTKQFYVEHSCLHRDGRWHDSGIRVTEAEVWGFVFGCAALFVPSDVVRSAAAGLPEKECMRGSHPTTGVAVPIGRLIAFAMKRGLP